MHIFVIVINFGLSFILYVLQFPGRNGLWKHSHGDSKIALIENDRIVFENNKIPKTFNTYFESVTD